MWFLSFLPPTGHWTLDSDGGKTKISPGAKTVSCENTITASHDESALMQTLNPTRTNPLKHGALILNRGDPLCVSWCFNPFSHNKAVARVSAPPWFDPAQGCNYYPASVISSDPGALSSWSQAVTRYRLWHESWPGRHVSRVSWTLSRRLATITTQVDHSVIINPRHVRFSSLQLGATLSICK